jgi:hypothetical protein
MPRFCREKASARTKMIPQFPTETIYLNQIFAALLIGLIALTG